MRVITLSLLLLPLLGLSQNKLSIEVLGVPNSNGNINVALYDNSEGFLKSDKVFLSESVLATEGKTAVLLDNVPDGEYAVALYHDVNGNHELDTNWLGIPKEEVGFSNAKMKTFGPPNFTECSFKLEDNLHIRVNL